MSSSDDQLSKMEISDLLEEGLPDVTELLGPAMVERIAEGALNGKTREQILSNVPSRNANEFVEAVTMLLTLAQTLIMSCDVLNKHAEAKMERERRIRKAFEEAMERSKNEQ